MDDDSRAWTIYADVVSLVSSLVMFYVGAGVAGGFIGALLLKTTAGALGGAGVFSTIAVVITLELKARELLAHASRLSKASDD